MEWVVLAVIGVVALLFVLSWVLRRQGQPAAPGRAAVEPDEYRVLLTMVLGDRDKAERLIDYEGRRDPSAGRPRLIKSAIERLRDDMRR